MTNLNSYLTAKYRGKGLKTRQTLTVKSNGRSADFIIPSYAKGCESICCAYCYVARHNSFGNPVTIYSNVDEIISSTLEFWDRLPQPKIPNQCDPIAYSFDIGESSDVLSSSLLPITEKVVVDLLTKSAHKQSWLKPTFATKIPARAKFITSLPKEWKGKARIRVSLMPQRVADVLEPGSNTIETRIKMMNEIFQKNWEVHLNFSPVILYDGWHKDYIELFRLVDSILLPEVKAQLKCECIFLTHHFKMNEMNTQWNPEAEDLLWTPELQEVKTNERGDSNVVRYKALTVKKLGIAIFKKLLASELEYCELRYIF